MGCWELCKCRMNKHYRCDNKNMLGPFLWACPYGTQQLCKWYMVHRDSFSSCTFLVKLKKSLIDSWHYLVVFSDSVNFLFLSFLFIQKVSFFTFTASFFQFLTSWSSTCSRIDPLGPLWTHSQRQQPHGQCALVPPCIPTACPLVGLVPCPHEARIPCSTGSYHSTLSLLLTTLSTSRKWNQTVFVF